MSLLQRSSASVAGTHKELDLTKLNKLVMELDGIADEEVVTSAQIQELADDSGTEASHYLAAMALCSDLRLAPNTDRVLARVCVGNCQRTGAIALMNQLLAAGLCDVAAINCIKQCERGPAAEIVTNAGTLVLAPASEQLVLDAVRQLRQA
jgi:NADH:ubiquinone oxidoreductase subunit E